MPESRGTSTAARTTRLDECLFGPERVCPPSVWDAVLAQGIVRDPKDIASNRDILLLSNSSNSSSNSPSKRLNDMDGIDDFDEGRWGAAKVSPVKSSSRQDHVVNLGELRKCASQGIAEEGNFRPVAWRVLLSYLPPNTGEWKETLLKHRQDYRILVSEVFCEPQHDGTELRGHHGKRHAKAAKQKKKRQEEEAARSNATSSTNGTSKNDDLKQVPTVESTGSSQLNGAEKASSSQANGNTTATIVPTRIREEWKKSGRDTNSLDSMRMLHTSMNTLLVQNEGTRTPAAGSIGKAASAESDSTNDNDNDQAAMTKATATDAQNDSPTSNEAQDENKDSPITANNAQDDNNNVDDNNDDDKWTHFFENATLLDEIRKDVVRTHPDLYFFLEPEHNLGQRRYAALERILFVWAKLNKGVRYVQGMNEIVGTIYYVLANDLNEEWACEAEADTYFLFNTLMSEMKDIFVPDLDLADTGIQGRISNMTSLLSLHDPEVQCHLVDIGIDPSFYAIRWLSTCLSREFLLPDTIRLWDSMFASTHKENFMRYVCVTMVMIVRDQLLKGDFSTCLRLLQSYPPTDIESLLESSRSLWIYESQITLACHKGGISLHQALCTITPPPSLVMAYGLRGGMATTMPVAAESTPSRHSRQGNGDGGRGNGRGGFLSGARNMLGGIGRELNRQRTESK